MKITVPWIHLSGASRARFVSAVTLLLLLEVLVTVMSTAFLAEVFDLVKVVEAPVDLEISAVGLVLLLASVAMLLVTTVVVLPLVAAGVVLLIALAGEARQLASAAVTLQPAGAAVILQPAAAGVVLSGGLLRFGLSRN